MNALTAQAQDDLERRKAETRIIARRLRMAVAAESPHSGQDLAKLFPAALLDLSPVAGYWPLGSEIDCKPLLDRLAAHGSVLLLPRVPDRTNRPNFHLWRPGDDMAPDCFGMLAPLPDAPQLRPSLIFCPLLAFDRKGGRLGQGGGHYDRVLKEYRPMGAIAMGLAFAAQELREIPTGPEDQRMDWVLTEKEAIAIA